VDAATQIEQPVKPKTSDVFPGFTFGGPIKKDKAFFFVGFNPEFNDYETHVYEGPGLQVPFSQNTQTYYTNARIDYAVNSKLRVYGSWLYQYQRQSGENLPANDSVQGYYNVSTGCFGALSSSDPTSPYYCTPFSGVPVSAYAHNIGYSAPNQTINTGADWTITNHLVSTTRFGYYFENYHDFGYPTGGNLYIWQSCGLPSCMGATDNTGAPLPADYQQANGYNNVAFSANDTSYNANKAFQVDQNFSWYKSGWGGTHNFSFGYQMNRLSNALYQHYNEPYTQLFVGNVANGIYYSPVSDSGNTACMTSSFTPYDPVSGSGCTGQYGYATVFDFGTKGAAISYNHGFFVQDAFTMTNGITINGGVRIEHEYLPGEGGPNGTALAGNPKPIDFGWGSKIAPRIGAAWDVFKDGRMKVFGNYGKFYDIMKLNVAISSFGGQYWQNCTYLLNTPDLSSINPAFGADGRYCEGPDATSEANFAGGGTPAGLVFIENQNNRAWPTTCSTCSAYQEGVAPGLKPYSQHETTFGVDYQLQKNLALEVRWDRRRLDNAIEDSAIYNPSVGETFVIVNPGHGVDSTYCGFWGFLYGSQAGCTNPGGPNPPSGVIPAARSYDGVEFRLTKATSHNWYGMFSYTWSHFRGNYTGLTSSDISDGGLGGRNAPNNSRAFDEPYFSWNDNGMSSSGLLPTDRPNKFKGYAYYNLKEGQKFSTDFGMFQYFYQGSPTTTFVDVGYAYPGQPAFPVDVVGRGNFINAMQDPTSGQITLGNPYVHRTPWYIQSDGDIQQNFHVSESKVLSFSATFTNLFNQHSVTAYNAVLDSLNQPYYIKPGGLNIAGGTAFYAAAMSPYNLQTLVNSGTSNKKGPMYLNSSYGVPLFWQLPRNIRLDLRFTF